MGQAPLSQKPAYLVVIYFSIRLSGRGPTMFIAFPLLSPPRIYNIYSFSLLIKNLPTSHSYLVFIFFHFLSMISRIIIIIIIIFHFSEVKKKKKKKKKKKS